MRQSFANPEPVSLGLALHAAVELVSAGCTTEKQNKEEPVVRGNQLSLSERHPEEVAIFG